MANTNSGCKQETAQETSPKSGASLLVGGILSALTDSLKQKSQDWIQGVVVDPLRTAGHKVAMLALLFVSVVLCIIFIAIGILQLLSGYFVTPGVPYLVMALILFVIALAASWSVSRDSGSKGDKCR